MASQSFPLLFSFRDLIAGNGFVAGVATDGRVLLTQEADGDHWMFGVTPGGIAGGGPERAVALREFKVSYLSVIYDIATSATSFEQFKEEVERFGTAVNEHNARAWEEALAEVRKSNVSLPNLPIVKAETKPPSIEVFQVELGKAVPTVNEFDEISEAA